MGRGNGQTDGGAAAYDHRAARIARERAEADATTSGKAATATALEWPSGCRTCDFTGKRMVAEHDREGIHAWLHTAACGCMLGRALTDRQGVLPMRDVVQGIEARFRIAIVDPTPLQSQPGGAARQVQIPKIGEYVPAHQRSGAPEAEAARRKANWKDLVRVHQERVAAGLPTVGMPHNPAPPPAPIAPAAPRATLAPAPPRVAPDPPAPVRVVELVELEMGRASARRLPEGFRTDEPPPWCEDALPERPPLDDEAQPPRR